MEMPFKRVKSAIINDRYVPSKVKTPSVFIKTLTAFNKTASAFDKSTAVLCLFKNRRIICANNPYRLQNLISVSTVITPMTSLYTVFSVCASKTSIETLAIPPKYLFNRKQHP